MISRHPMLSNKDGDAVLQAIENIVNRNGIYDADFSKEILPISFQDWFAHEIIQVMKKGNHTATQQEETCQ
jgi:hypothetical protein